MTRAQLQNRILTILNVIGAGQSAGADDVAVVDDLIGPAVAKLSANQIVDIDPDDIGDEYFEDLAGLIANAAAPSFSQTFDPGKRLFYEGELRRLAAAKPTFETLHSLYY